jgi:S-DNA-T family DNA segregation ATPase FtsK/SpoIIIE
MGVPVALRLDRHLLIGGETGGGKSVALSAIVASAACDPSIRLVLLDAKRLELAIWKHAADAFVGPSLEDAGAVLKEVRDEVDRRTTIMEAECAKTGIPVRNAMPDMSRIVVIIDELAEYTNCGKESAEIVSTLRSLVSLGRAVGVVIVAATQKPQASVVPSEVRDLFPYRFALRCGTPQMSDTILGSGWASREADASRLPSQPGLGLLLVDGYQPQRIQTYPLSDAELASLSQQARERRSST